VLKVIYRTPWAAGAEWLASRQSGVDGGISWGNVVLIFNALQNNDAWMGVMRDWLLRRARNRFVWARIQVADDDFGHVNDVWTGDEVSSQW
jgi:hypothetical protein